MIMPILSASNINDSVAFYRDKLGFSVMAEMPGPDGNIFFAIVNMGAATFGLSANPAPDPKGNGVVFMVYVPEGTTVDEHCAMVQANGVTLADELTTQYWGDRTYAVTDPDGYFLMIAQTVQEMSVEDIQSAQPTSV